MITLTIDGREIQVQEGCTILDAAREHHVPIPTLCYHEALAPFAACRVCVVELENRRGGQLVPACAYACEEGLIVRTNSERVRRSRRMTIELLMASAAHVPLIRAMAEELGVTTPRFTMEPDDCILCGLCVRACHEIVGVGAISLIDRGIEKKVSPPFHIASNACIECGTCILVCPTGAITLADITGGARTVHPWGSEFETVDCRVFGHQTLAPQFADHAALLAEPAPSSVEGEAVS
ncbi:MAG: (2Fe-2S)-binding protein [Anaerolineae bacterium]|nr:MAG: (2Fe-2S)-binding protein [Anaerolineae bacterium]